MTLRYAASILVLTFTLPALAQQPSPDMGKRVDALEGQMRAVQRKVFPGGNPKYFEPEFPQGTNPSVSGVAEPPASTTAIADINVRLQALEKQIAEITGRIETNENRTRLLEEQFRKFQEDIEFRLNPANAAPAPAPAVNAPVPVLVPSVTPTAPTPAPLPSAKAPATAKPPAVAPKAPAPLPPSTTLVPIRPAAPSDAPYQAAYAAYQAKRYDDAIAMFEDFVNKNPRHALASNALFWQGRAYYAKKQFGLAARSHLRGYDRYRDADKAEDNLLSLADSLAAVGRREQACEALGEHQAVYKTASAANRARAEALRKSAKCG